MYTTVSYLYTLEVVLIWRIGSLIAKLKFSSGRNVSASHA